MAKQIMLLFLSDVKITGANFKDRGEKILVGKVEPHKYDMVGYSKTTNESAVKYLLMKYPDIKLDKVYVIATKMVRNEDVDKKTGKPKEWRFVDTSYSANPEKVWTHLEYFFDRIHSVVSDIYDIKEVFNYDEDAPIQDSMQTVVDVAKEVQKYIRNEDKVIVHADFTGGMRHANMVMLDVIRLLQYDKRVAIGKILYSNFNSDPKKVEEANSIYGLVDLIAGAEEFVRFGSVNTLKDYYDGKPISDELEKVLKAMTGFAEAIRLCHYGSFKDSIENLRTSLKAFHTHMEKLGDDDKHNDEIALNDKFMARLEGRIRENYGDILKDKLDDLNLIQWCVDNNYLQQALTLYIERVPEVLCQEQHEILALTSNGMRDFNAEFDETHDVRTRNFYLINAFKNAKEQGRIDKALTQIYRDHVEDFQKISRAIKKNRPTVPAEIKACVDELSKEVEKTPGLRLNAKKLDEVAQTIQDMKDIEGHFKKPDNAIQHIVSVYEETLTIQYKNKYNQYTEEDLKKFLDEQFLSLTPEKMSSKIISFLAGNLTKEAAKKIFSALYFEFAYSHDIVTFIRDGKMQSHIPVAALETILDRYGVLKNERNHSNHARADESEFTTDSLKKEITAGLTDLRAAIASIQ